MRLQIFEIRYFLFKIIDISSDTQIKCSITPQPAITPLTSSLACLMCLCVGATAHTWRSETPIVPLAWDRSCVFASHARSFQGHLTSRALGCHASSSVELLGSHTRDPWFCRLSALFTESSSQPHSTLPALPPSLLPSLSPCSHTKSSIYSQISNYFKISNYIYLYICTHMLSLCTCVYVCVCVAEVRGQRVGVISLLISRRSKGSNSGCQVRQPVSSLACSPQI